MGHGTMVSGVQRAVTGGLSLVGGVQRKITKGMTLVNGVQREISFGPSLYTINVTSSFPNDNNDIYLEIGGTKYSTSTTIEVEPGTAVKAHVRSVRMYSCITFNGLAVATTTDDTNWDYSFVADSNLAVSLEFYGPRYLQDYAIIITTT